MTSHDEPRFFEFVSGVYHAAHLVVTFVWLTLCVAILAPIYVAMVVIPLFLLVVYFVSLVTEPSWSHLYLAFAFAVAVILVRRAMGESLPPRLNRGRQIRHLGRRSGVRAKEPAKAAATRKPARTTPRRIISRGRR